MSRDFSHKLGMCQWFHFGAHDDVERAVAEMRALGARRLRTGVCFAEYHRAGGPAWYDWLFEELAGLDLLVPVWHGQPSRGDRRVRLGPPQRVTDYGVFVGQVIDRYGGWFSDIELWNQSGQLAGADARRRARWPRLAEMIAFAAEVARDKGKRVVLGGDMAASDEWLALLAAHGVLAYVDVLGVHGLAKAAPERAPGRERSGRRGWEEAIARVRAYCPDKPIWITDIGLPTWDARAERPGRYRRQAELLGQVAQAAVDRVYWRSLFDLDPEHADGDGLPIHASEHHLGLVSWEGDRKPAWGLMKHLLAGEREPLALPPDLDQLDDPDRPGAAGADDAPHGPDAPHGSAAGRPA